MTLTTQPGIILRKAPYSDADEIVTVLLREGGVQRFFAAGARKSKKTFGGRIDYFAALELRFSPRNEGLWRLWGAEEQGVAVPSPWQDPRNFAVASYLAEVICAFTPAAVHSEDLFTLWIETAAEAGRQPATPASFARQLARFLVLFGYAIDWRRCVGCGDPAQAPYAFDEVRGGPVCTICRGPGPSSGLFPPDLINFVTGLQEDGGPQHPLRQAQKLAYQLVRFTALILQKPVKSEEFLKRVLC
jgi:DNA repair protein RecO (recombination protein O)